MKKMLLCFGIAAIIVSFINGCGGKLENLGRARRSVNTVVVHHTAGEFSNNIDRLSREISQLHRQRFPKMEKSAGLYVAYHYLITPDGKMWQTRDAKDIGHHAGNWNVNKRSLAVCLVGDFSKYRPTKKQVKSLDALVKRIKREHSTKTIIPHSRCRATLCCGKYLKREIQKLSWGRNFK